MKSFEWTFSVRRMDTDSIFEDVKKFPEFKEAMRIIRNKFMDTHEELKVKS